MEFMEVVRKRRSVRSYSDRPVEDEKLEAMLEAARLAPSWVNKQCWHYIILKDKNNIAKVTSATMIFNKFLNTAPVLVVVCGDPEKSGSHNGLDYFLVDVAISLEHFVLAGTDQGLGTCWIGGFNEEQIKEILSIPERIRVVALTPVGYQSEEPTLGEIVRKKVIRGARRKAVSEFVHRERW